MLGVQRIVSFVRAKKPEWMSDDVELRLRVVDHDLRTLDEFDDQLTNKLQFLLDASLGFISTDQNHVMKVLTVTSVATIPPVILAGVWGMEQPTRSRAQSGRRPARCSRPGCSP